MHSIACNILRPLIPLVLLTSGACASSGTAAVGAAPVMPSIGMAGSIDRLNISAGSGPNLNALDATPDAIWRVLPAAFDSVGVPVTRLDAAGKVIGNNGFKIRQRLGKVALSRYIDCGETQIGPNADSYEVYLTVLVQVRPVGTTSSSLVTTFEASARPIAFSQAYSRCSSRGSLETKLLAAIKAQLPR